VAPITLNGIWALDFMHEALYGGRRFRTLNVLDEAKREGLAIEVGASIPATRVICVLEQLVTLYGRPQALRLDNGPELTAEVFTVWCHAQQIALRYIQPGKPDQNAFIERFNRTYREEVLNAYVFASLSEVQALTDEWLLAYNERRSYDALGRVPPTRFLPRSPAPRSPAPRGVLTGKPTFGEAGLIFPVSSDSSRTSALGGRLRLNERQ
jgi:putative transposase